MLSGRGRTAHPEMSFRVVHRYGANDRDPPLETLASLVSELDEDPDDIEHTSVGVVHESDWSIEAFINGLVTLEHLEELDIEPRHLYVSNRDEAVQLLRTAAEGRFDELFAEPWQPGYGSGTSP
jgi:hypothetical protein